MYQFNEVKTFVFFIGYPRSGHSLVGACLDAHPNAVISHELDALSLVMEGKSRLQLFEAICEKARLFYEQGNEWSGYSYRVPDMWQGLEKSIEVIGDKRGGLSTNHLEAYPELLEKVKDLAANYRMIHVVKNPFDCISTAVMRQEKLQGRKFSAEDINRKIKEFFNRARTNSSIIEKVPDRVMTIRYENLLKDSEAVLSQLCTFLGLTIFDDYLKACSSIIWPSGRPSRLKSTIWEPSLIEFVQEQIDQFYIFEGYNFQSE